MGFDVKRFKTPSIVGAIPRIVCAYCRLVLKDPMAILSCGHNFCKECIEGPIGEAAKCPEDGKSFSLKDIEEGSSFLRLLLGDLELTCDFASLGCKQFIPTKNLASHQESCPFNPKALSECPHNCGALFPSKDRETHSCVNYLVTILDDNKRLGDDLKAHETRKMAEIKDIIKDAKQVHEKLKNLLQKLSASEGKATFFNDRQTVEDGVKVNGSREGDNSGSDEGKKVKKEADGEEVKKGQEVNLICDEDDVNDQAGSGVKEKIEMGDGGGKEMEEEDGPPFMGIDFECVQEMVVDEKKVLTFDEKLDSKYEEMSFPGKAFDTMDKKPAEDQTEPPIYSSPALPSSVEPSHFKRVIDLRDINTNVADNHINGKCATSGESGNKQGGNNGKQATDRGKELQISVEGNEWAKKVLRSHGRDVEVLMKRLELRCSLCNKLFNRQSLLLAHQPCYSERSGITGRSDTELPYQCEFCPHRCNELNNLRKHLAVHVDINIYKCIVCGKGFSRENEALVHFRVHSGDRPYRCDFCRKTFTQSLVLKDHIRLHTGEKPFKCLWPGCEKLFLSAGNRLDHMKRVHKKQKDKECPSADCGKRFVTAYEAKSHFNRHHKGQM